MPPAWNRRTHHRVNQAINPSPGSTAALPCGINYLREAKRRGAIQPDELVSTVVNAVAHDHFRHVLRKQARVPPLRRRTR
jgi:hypothetical protein